MNFEENKNKIYQLICEDLYVPMKIKEIAILLQIPKDRRNELAAILVELMNEGKIEISKKGKYQKTQQKKYSGKFSAHQRGFGFVTVEGEEQDVFISDRDVHGAMNGDVVEIVLTAAPEGRRREGKIVKILEHGTTRVVGYFEKSKAFGFVKPDDQRLTRDIFIESKNTMGAITGHKVVVELTYYGSETKKPEGKVVEIIGHVNDPGTDILSIVKAFGLTTEFPREVLIEVEQIPDEVERKEEENRLDIRELQMVTIDGEDAKDLDDAVSLTKNEKGYELGVHIADVTHYVRESSELDKEALERGTSTYLVDRVIPMLPHKLSNGIRSLNAGVDRLALSCFMTIDNKGEVIDHKIVETLIRVDRRMSYTQVKAILEEPDSQDRIEFKEQILMLEEMGKVADLLRNQRQRRGSIDFDFPETKMILDEKGKPIEIKPYDRNVATKLIEDFMLIANETVAEDFFWQEMPFVYRTHDKPDPEKIEKLKTFINNFGYILKGDKETIHPKELQMLLASVEGKDEEALISRLTLRSMKQARYTPENSGHFGLAATYYCHFTSPIRRYPDLQIHRIIKDRLNGRMSKDRIEHYQHILQEVSKQCSERERRSEEAERETIKLKKVEYMQEHQDELFDGVISSVTSWGFYVELANTIEGLVHITQLDDDYYDFIEASYELVGKATNRRFKLGEKVQVKVDKTDRLLRTIDFKLAEGSGASGKRTGRYKNSR